MKAAEFIQCCSFEVFEASLGSIREQSNACIISCLSNFIVDSSGSDSVSKRVEPRIQEVYDLVFEACRQSPSRSYLVSPPMYRTSPSWYREGLSEIVTVVSQVFSDDKPANLHLLPSFSLLDFESDGIHLTPYSGLEHILHLLDASESLLNSRSLPVDARSLKDREASRVLEDRVTVLEQDHRRLNRVLDSKTAVDSELADFHANERMEDYFVVTGLPRVPADLTGKDWQQRALRDVQGVIRSVTGSDLEVVVVQNATPRARDADVVYNVKMASVQDARQVRKKFGAFFKGGEDHRPPHLKSLSIANRVTPDTKIRISLMKLLAKKYKDSNPGSKAQVIGYESRPLLKIIPPQGASDRRVRTFNYVEAVTTLPFRFTPAELAPITRRLNPRLSGQVKAVFIVLSDDSLGQKPRNDPGAPDPEPMEDNTEATEVSEVTATPLPKSSRSGRPSKRGADSISASAAKK
jgi:hypothetical protein